MGAVERRKRDYKITPMEHQLLALEDLFTKDQLTSLKNVNHPTFPNEELARIGIVHRNSEGKPQFIHRTFAEYYVAEFLIKHLKSKPQPKVQDFLLNKVLLNPECNVIRAFLDGLLEVSKPSVEVLEDYGQKLDKMWEERKERGQLGGEKTALFQAATEDNANIIGLIEDSLTSVKRFHTLAEMMSAKDGKGQSALFISGKNGSLNALNKISLWFEGVLNIH
jgi:hypothetical protein